MVHLCGGSIALLAAWIIGPRIGRFPKNGQGEASPINGHSMSVSFFGLGFKIKKIFIIIGFFLGV